jgi:endonuclease/exonuclease/phosphatase family metal-dependent hydrolase
VTTTRARLRPRSGGRVPSALAELALPALTVVSGLQLLRLMVATVVSVYRDRLGAPLAGLALFALAVVGLGFLAPTVARLVGRRGLLVGSAAGVAVVRLVLQLVPDAVARWLLAAVGVVLFLWFVPAWLARDGRGFGLALLVGLALDTALAGLGGSWDYAWSIGVGTVALAALLAGGALWALAALPDPTGESAGRSGTAGAEGGSKPSPGRRPWAVLPLAGIGPALFLHALAWQNLGWQAVFGGRSQAQAFLLVMAANLAALAAGTATALAGEVRWPAVATALAGLAVAVALAQERTVAACVLGQAAVAALLVTIVRRATGLRRDGVAGMGAVAAAWTAGMGLFVLLVLVYYAAYDVVLPGGNGYLPALAATLLGLAAALAMRGDRERRGAGLRPATGRLRPAESPVGVAVGLGVALLAAPALFWVTAPDPVAAVPDPGAGPTRPVRVLSYNLHFGFDVEGWSDLEATARAIEASGAEVVGLQEVSRGWYVNGSTDLLAWLQRRLRMPYMRFAGASDPVWGNAVLSRYPIVAGQVVRLPREGVPLRRSALRVEVDLGVGRRLRVVVTHLHHLEGPEGARVRLAQLPRLLDTVAGQPATVLMGDLNAEPGSAEIALVRRAGLTDAFLAAGGGPADELTWPSDRPDRRIDYIWLSGDLTATGFVATTSTASDHRGIAVTVRQRR